MIVKKFPLSITIRAHYIMKDNREFEGAKWTNVTITTLCGLMTNTAKTSVLDRLTDVNNLSLKIAGEKCLDYTYGSQV